jgi:hypothetical protein
MLLINGAQLYESKQSDCWIYIWFLLDLAPDLLHKKKYILLGGFIWVLESLRAWTLSYILACISFGTTVGRSMSLGLLYGTHLHFVAVLFSGYC